ncbi:unnamed protein product [Albugo candida]|uniref:Glutamine cyclotransferase n=1 Tax=Albugo candida TaxID=65357 RepID=A0A024G4B8_9STRA|nr:unnamed protein product [Albugo candida]|eukprot:CCI41611.1 unnamed protein product [Albugo candida]
MRRVIEPNPRSLKKGKAQQKKIDDPQSITAPKDAILSEPHSIPNTWTSLTNHIRARSFMVKVVSLALFTSMFVALWIHPDAMPLFNDGGKSIDEGAISLKSAKNFVPSKSMSIDHNLNHVKTDVIILDSYPHDAKAFTQGLLVVQQNHDKYFIESTGLYGESTLRKVDITTGKVLTQTALPSNLFGEGITLSRNQLLLLTWKSGNGFTYELSAQKKDGRNGIISESFSRLKKFAIKTQTGEGWGIDGNGTHLILSDGSSRLYVLSPDTLKQIGTVEVTLNGQRLKYLNELEVVGRYIYANVWYENSIVKIDSGSGKVVAVYECSNVIQKVEELAQKEGIDFNTNDGAVLNGIAYDGDSDVFYITGKLWPFVFGVRLVDSYV